MSRRKEMTAERAAAIVNDIHEGCCRASRKTLMEVASYYAIRECELYSEGDHAHVAILTTALSEYAKFKERHSKPATPPTP